ncbi:MAG TPA: hypothetical protein PLW44_15050 [Chitinophagales bacterium]|nr:hypothetical protein [Chitinophagales bacterium]
MLPTTGVIKSDHTAMFLKGDFIATPATLVLTSSVLCLQVDNSGPSARILFDIFPGLKRRFQRLEMVFELNLANIQVAQGEFGRNKNVLQVTDERGKSYKVIVQNLNQWLSAIKLQQ